MEELAGQRVKTAIYCFINKGMLASAGHGFTFDPEKKRPEISDLCVSHRRHGRLKSVCVLAFFKTDGQD